VALLVEPVVEGLLADAMVFQEAASCGQRGQGVLRRLLDVHHEARQAHVLAVGPRRPGMGPEGRAQLRQGLAQASRRLLGAPARPQPGLDPPRAPAASGAERDEGQQAPGLGAARRPVHALRVGQEEFPDQPQAKRGIHPVPSTRRDCRRRTGYIMMPLGQGVARLTPRTERPEAPGRPCQQGCESTNAAEKEVRHGGSGQARQARQAWQARQA
jgi:hypothetical protein